VSDAGQRQLWPTIKKFLTPGKALAFSHGFSIVYKDQTKVIPPKGVDVILVAPKGSGLNVRRNFLAGAGINSSYACSRTPPAAPRALRSRSASASAPATCSPPPSRRKWYSDLTGERGVLMGALAGIMEAQYEVLRKNGHSPSEAFNETVEELTQSLIRLVDENGMDWMYGNCSTTAQRGALDWKPKFKKATLPVFKALYKRQDRQGNAPGADHLQQAELQGTAGQGTERARHVRDVARRPGRALAASQGRAATERRTG
jgi:ketol-acid reductoisomerase